MLTADDQVVPLDAPDLAGIIAAWDPASPPARAGEARPLAAGTERPEPLDP